jgi:hypothetical protein
MDKKLLYNFFSLSLFDCYSIDLRIWHSFVHFRILSLKFQISTNHKQNCPDF